MTYNDNVTKKFIPLRVVIQTAIYRRPCMTDTTNLHVYFLSCLFIRLYYSAGFISRIPTSTPTWRHNLTPRYYPGPDWHAIYKSENLWTNWCDIVPKVQGARHLFYFLHFYLYPNGLRGRTTPFWGAHCSSDIPALHAFGVPILVGNNVYTLRPYVC